MAEKLLDEMIVKINQITTSLGGTIAQINQMSTAIQTMSQKFSEETISVNENIRLIVEVLKQFRMKSGESMQEIIVLQTCGCGCNEITKLDGCHRPRRFVKGHNWRGVELV